MNRITVRILIAACAALLAASAVAGIDARLLRYPDVSETQIAFVYAGDIWIVPKEGGQAVRLSTPAGEESFPRFSPDGKSVAFSGNYDGNTDVYVMPAGGGIPTRVTHHPLPDRMLDWYPDGDGLLVASFMQSGRMRFRQLYRVPAQGGLPEKLPVPYGEFGAISPDGKKLAYMPLSRDFRTWKRYRGGMAPDLWLFDLEDLTSKNLTANNANDAQPMWHGSTLYFLSDRDESKRANIWAYETGSGALRQVTKFTRYDARFPSIGPADIVLEAGGRLHRIDLGTEEMTEVEVTVVTDRATLKPRMEKVADLIFGGDISPSGKRVVVAARGDLFTLPAEHGVIRNLSRSSGVAERTPAWSPDGTEIAYFSDRSGDYELTVRPSDGSGEETVLTSMGAGYRYTPYWSPDGKKIVFVDQAMKIQIFDRETGNVKVIDQGLYMMEGPLRNFSVSWSADSRWIAYSRALETRFGAVFLYDTMEGELHQVTSGYYGDFDPAFDPEGKYLYFFSNRTFRPSYSDIDNTWIYPNTTNVVAAPLRKDVPSPLAARNDEEEGKKDEEKGEDDNGKKDDGKKGKKKKDEGKDEEEEDKEPEPVEIDLQDFERRVVVLPPEAGNYNSMAAVAGKVIYRRMPRTGSGGEERPIVYYDLKEREEKTIIGDADGYALAAGGEKMLVVKDDTWAIIEPKEGQKLEKKLATGDLQAMVDPVAEWRQIFTDAWRLERDYFYDPDLHGVDWNEMRERYGALLEDAVTRWDVDFIIGELIAELNASHTYRGGGDMEQPKRANVGLLGADYALENGAFRIVKILDGAAWDAEVRSPLNVPGVDVDEGDYLLAVNGEPLDISRDPWAAFQGLGGKTVMLSINSEPTLEGAREVLVETLTSEIRLRHLAWIEKKRSRVEEATGGRVGYAYVRSTGIDGQTELVRQFAPQFMKDALIIDERFNSGGQIPDRFVELLNRPLYNFWGVRDGMDWQWPPIAHTGPKVMLINGWSGSGGDAFPFYFRAAGIGPLIGTRTWGGLIGVSGSPRLIDGGGVTVPTFGMYSTDGEWIVEGYGVDPDIEVIDDPALMVDGTDPQLERAIQEVMRMLESAPAARPGKPAYPDRSGF